MGPGQPAVKALMSEIIATDDSYPTCGTAQEKKNYHLRFKRARCEGVVLERGSRAKEKTHNARTHGALQSYEGIVCTAAPTRTSSRKPHGRANGRG